MATPTMPSAATQESEQVQALRRLGAQRGYSPEEVQSRLEQSGLVQAQGSGFGHAAGVAARGLVQGAGNLVGLPFGMAGQAYQAATGNQPPAMLQPQGANVANQMGLPQPTGPGERVAMAAGENGMMAAALPGAGAAGIALGAGAGAAGQTAAENGAGPLGQAAASMAVGVGVPVVGALGAAAIRSMLAGASSRRLAAEQSAALLRAGNPNAALSLGQVAQGGVSRLAQAGIRNMPGANQVLRENSDLQASQMGQTAGRIADDFSLGGTPASAGAAIQRGISEGYIPRFKSVAGKLYERAYSFIPPETPVIPSHTVKLAADMDALQASARPLSDRVANPKVMGIMHDLASTLEENPQGIPFNVLKELRSRLGSILSGDELVSDINLRDVRRIYGSLSEDMTDAVAAQGPDAMGAWGKAETFWKTGMDRIERILQPLADQRTPEKAFTAVMSGSREGASILQGTMRSLGPEERRLVQATVVRRLGVANPGMQDAAGDTFSPETFLTRWNTFAPEARTALFEGVDTRTVGNLNALAKAVEIRKKAAGTMPNPSGTAPNTAFFAILSGLGSMAMGAATGNLTGGAIGAAGAPLVASTGATIAAKAFTSPRLINWMVKQTQVPFGAMAQQIALLAKQSQSWSDEDRATADSLVSSLGNVDWNQILTAQAVADGLAH